MVVKKNRPKHETHKQADYKPQRALLNKAEKQKSMKWKKENWQQHKAGKDKKQNQRNLGNKSKTKYKPKVKDKSKAKYKPGITRGNKNLKHTVGR